MTFILTPVEIVIRHEIRVSTYNARHKHPRKSDFTHNELYIRQRICQSNQMRIFSVSVCVCGYAWGPDDFPEIVTIDVSTAVSHIRVTSQSLF
jgi:hypothetical protein